VEITLARALKYKNRVVQRLTTIASDICQYNSKIEGSEDEVDIDLLMREYAGLKQHLINLKFDIMQATLPIQKTIIELQEMKGYIGFLNSIPTRSGKVEVRKSPYSNEQTDVRYHATVRKFEVDKLVREFNEQIDSKQELIDSHNNSAKIEVEIKTL
jgi:hypothetical protein